MYGQCVKLKIVPKLAFFSLIQFPAVTTPQTLKKRYQGSLSAILIDFTQVRALIITYSH